ncbi:MAG: NAD(P)/FAD-dependent oxidoreductase [Acidobacteria bacterium]|nr:NAD(P)/FAD-dependent oxidoreductase [Acidobacteriota bacterium]
MVDVLITGGGVAGSSLAILLGRQGVTVELFERGQFPKEKPCGEGLMPGGVAVLERMGLAEAVGGAPFFGIRYHFRNQIAEGRFPTTEGFPPAGRGQRRKHLDHVLFSAAAMTPGVTAYTGVHVDGPLVENGKVVGLLVEGEPRRATLTVAADGLHSRIRRSLGLDVPVKRRRLGARCHFRLARDKEWPPWVDVFVSRGRELYVTALPDRELLVAALVDTEALREPVEQAFRRWWQAEPALHSRLEDAEQVSSLRCISPLAGHARCGVAPGVVLLGDAAGFLDPITGGGMTQALMTAELLAKYIRRGLTGINEWLWDFERQRKLLLRDYHRLTQAVLWLADYPSLSERIISTLQFVPGLLSHLIAVAGGMRPLCGTQRKWRSTLEPARFTENLGPAEDTHA